MRCGVILVVSLVLVGCSSGGVTRTAASPSRPGTTTGRSSWPATSPGPAISKVLVFIEENHSLSQMQTGMPYLYSQAAKFGYATHFSAITHPSLPNYLSIALGSSFGISDDNGPNSHPQSPPDVFGEALAAGSTAKAYQESMPSPCATTDNGPYVVKHNAWAYVADEHRQCLANDIASGTTTSGALHDDIAAGTLPNIGEVVPNLNDDAHDGTLATADAWLKDWLAQIMTSPDYKSGHLAIVITADEDDHNQGNTVLTTVIHPSQHNSVVTTNLTDYSLTGLLTQVGHAPCIANGCHAASFAAAFGLTVK